MFKKISDLKFKIIVKNNTLAENYEYLVQKIYLVILKKL